MNRELRVQKKIILNQQYPDCIEVVIGEVEAYEHQVHYILSFGGDKTIRIIGKQNWDKLVEMVQWLHWDPDVTQELYIPALDRFSEANTEENKLASPFTTLEYEIDEIIDGIPVYDDEG